MPNRYDDLYAWAYAAFGSRPFTSSEFGATFPSPSTGKVLHDLTRLGYFERKRHGVYRVIGPAARAEAIVARGSVDLELPERAGLPYAYCEATAITVWTDGGYWAGITRGYRPLHIRVRTADLRRWKSFFRAAGARAVTGTGKATMFGTVFVVHPATALRAVRHGGVSVALAAEAHEFADSRRYAFEPVVGLLRELAGRRQ